MDATGWSAVWMVFATGVALRASALLLLGWLASVALARASAATRRHLWMGVVLALLILPVASLTAPSLPMPVLAPPPTTPPPLSGALVGDRWLAAPPTGTPPRPDRPSGPSPAPVARVTVAPATHLPWWRLPPLLMVYLAGVAVALARLGRARGRAAALVRSSRAAGAPWPQPPGVEVRESDEVRLPLTVGARRPVVLLPAAGRGWPPEWRAAVLDHEAAHARGRDPLWQLLAEIACALYWFHPLVHLAVRRLRVERELAADDEALAAGIRPASYARVLYELACIPDSPPAAGAVVPLLTPTGLKARVVAALEAGRRRGASPIARVALAALGLASMVPLAAAVPVQRAGRGVLIGRAVDRDSGRPVPRAEVAFRTPIPGSPAAVVRTDSDGWFRYPPDLPWRPGFEVYARAGTRAGRKEILAVPYGTALPVTLELRPAKTLTGIVRDDGDRPIAGAAVSILTDETYAPGPHRGVLARTDRQGRWRADGILYGTFRLLVEAPWGVATTALVLVDGAGEQVVDTVVPREWPLTGWVRDENGRPLAGAKVAAGPPHLFHAGRSTVVSPRSPPERRHLDWDDSEADGSFRLLARGQRVSVEGTAADGGNLFGEFDDGAQQVVANHGERRVLPAREGPVVVTVHRASEVAGSVRDERGAPVSGATVVAAALGVMRVSEVTATTDSHGRFALAPLPPGDLEVIARFGWTPFQAQTHIRLHPGESRDGVEIVVPR